jgi:predicted O-methyltransferase YrrM
MTDYRSRSFLPVLVRRAMDAASRVGFEDSCTPEVGRLLYLLASQVREGTIGEIGTGACVGSAWIATALAPTASFISVDQDEQLVVSASELLMGVSNARILHGDWTQILDHGPFDLLFVDAFPVKRDERAIEALRVGGMAVLDDMTPEDQWPEDWKGHLDEVRSLWLNDPRLTATEIFVTPKMQCIVAVRVA